MNQKKLMVFPDIYFKNSFYLWSNYIVRKGSTPKLINIKLMKKIYLIALVITILVLLLSSTKVAAQNFYYATYQGDTINLSINTSGDIQWQQTEDTTTSWTNITGADTSNYTLYTSGSTTGFKYYRARILDSILCNNYYYSDIIKHRIISSTSDVQLGDWFEGGIVFYIDGAGSGLIAANRDQGTAAWGCEGTIILGADSTSIGNGAQNTIDILAGCSNIGIAANICDNLTLNGYTDWFLPSKNELNALYLHRAEINYEALVNGGNTFSNILYWSSSEFSSNNAWMQHFGTSAQLNYNKNFLTKVRAIRTFSPPLHIQLDSITNINPVSAAAHATVSDSGTATVTQRGICWSTTTNPTLNDSTTISGAGIGSYNSMAIQLTANTTYYIKAFAINSVDTAYSNEQSFTTTIGTQALYDIDGNGYDTVHIGTQIWMKQNLNVTHYPNGDTIPYITDNTTWANLAITGDGFSYYNNNANGEANTYGALYNYAATIGDNWDRDNTINQGVCPDGYHLPSDAEWDTLTTYLGGTNVAGGKMKETGTSHWNSPNTGSDNSSGFSALPGGTRSSSTGSFYDKGNRGLWWSSTEYNNTVSYNRILIYNNNEVTRSINFAKSFGMSVRCVKNLSIGDSYGGGIIAYIFVSGDPGYVAGETHGLIAAASDQSTGIQWYNGSNVTTGAIGTALGAGFANTNTIVNIQGIGNYAAKLCYDLTLNGYSDWFLPSKNELNKLYINKTAIGGFATYYYWSSSENSSNLAWLQYFNNGRKFINVKYGTIKVRAVRAF